MFLLAHSMDSQTVRNRYTFLVATVVLSLLLPRTLDAQTEPDPSPLLPQSTRPNRPVIDFENQIWPIFHSHCVPCHGSAKAAGDLRLDDYQSVLRGGHSGNVIIGTVNDSELLRRLKSSEEGYRMPKEGAHLTQDQIVLIETWIEQGGKWELASRASEGQFQSSSSSPTDPRSESSYVLLPEIQFLAAPTLAVLIAILLIERRKKRSADRPMKSSGGSAFDRVALRARSSHYMICFLSLAVAALTMISLHERTEREEIFEKFDRLRQSSNFGGRDPGDFTILHPKHPPRLGGLYFRGNDERSPRLFNGGFYRTATLELSLQDSRANDLRRGDRAATGSLHVHLEIDKAPFATSALFRDQQLAKCTLSSYPMPLAPHSLDENPSFFDAVTPGQTWASSYSIAMIDSAGESSDGNVMDPITGTLYVSPSGGRPHYGIRYNIQFNENNEISETSELWMGVIMAPENVIIHEPPRLTLQEWYDFRPIPKIEGGNTNDPDLLGISEHEQSAQSVER